MNYIVFDLEWNQAAEGKDAEHPQLPFEIIEIGAQKLNEQLELCESFHALAKPVVYTKLNFHTQEIVGLTERDLKKGEGFAKICRDFLEFCGDDCMFATWGSMDLTELQRNMRFFGVQNPFPKPLFYYDVQKLYSLAFEDGKLRRSLEHAVDTQGIARTKAFHRAHHDAFYTAQILKRIPPDIIKTHYSVDYYHTPKSKKDELHLHYPEYYKYVSREFFSKEEAMADKTVTTIRCTACNRALRKKVRWFSGTSRIYYALAECPEHGYVKGKIRLKRNDDDRIFAIKTVKLTTDEGAERIQLALEEMRRKRREKVKMPK
ncbi:MAG: exonuclease domain-containing protein [Lachnospiraceae bacterium]|nr:exonuclease domain-containing protein [Lachnospiraceae bacterium]